MRELTPDARRKDDFAPGVPVVLGDGNTWELARPMFGDFIFVRDEAGKTSMRRAFGWDGYEQLVDRLIDEDDGLSASLVQFDIAYAMLSRNYDVSANEAGRHLLTVVPPDDPRKDANDTMWSAVIQAGLGQAPKATAVG